MVFCIELGAILHLNKILDAALAGMPFSLNQLIIFVKLSSVLYVITMALIKLSLGAYFFRIFTVAHRPQRHFIVAILVLTGITTIINVCFCIFTCGASAGFLDEGASCKYWLIYGKIASTWSGMNILGDFVFAFLAVNAIWSIQMSIRTKVLTIFILIIGTLGGIASVIRLVEIDGHGPVSSMTTGVQAAIWSIAEIGAAMLAANAACLRPLATKLFGQVLMGVSAERRHDGFGNTYESHTSYIPQEGGLRIFVGGFDSMAKKDEKDTAKLPTETV